MSPARRSCGEGETSDKGDTSIELKREMRIYFVIGVSRTRKKNISSGLIN